MTSHEDKRREIGWDPTPRPDGAPPELVELHAALTKGPPRGVGWLDKLMTRATVHGTWMSRAFVDKDDAKRRALRRSLTVRVVLAVSSWLVMVFDDNVLDVAPVVYFIAPLIFGVSLSTLATRTWNEAHTYRRGWTDGREEMRKSARESWLRGMSIEEWWEREQRRDWGVW